jgi:2'-5' RNA ligase
MRLLVAAEPSASVRRKAAGIASTVRNTLEMKGVVARCRWLPQENLHFTVWFLGELCEERSAAVLGALGPALGQKPFRLHLSGLGTFPPSGSPRVIWMGVTEGGDALSRVHDEVATRLAPWGFQQEARPYSAHLTLARVKEPLSAGVSAGLRDALAKCHADAGTCRIDALTVFRSRTSPSGAVYEPLLRVPLS